MTGSAKVTFWAVVSRATVVHTISYFIVGLLAMKLLNYRSSFAEPPLSYFMRGLDDPFVMAGVLFQPIRGLLFGVVFYLLRERLFSQPHGWSITWVMLTFVGIFSTFAPAPGSIEGLVYTTVPLAGQFGGLAEVLLQSLLLSVLTVFWVKHREKAWLNRVMAALFFIALLLPTLGLLVAER